MSSVHPPDAWFTLALEEDASEDLDVEEDLVDPPELGPFLVVRCTEADDFTSPRGETLHMRKPWIFPSHYGGNDWAPSRVTEGKAYIVGRDGEVIAELLE